VLAGGITSLPPGRTFTWTLGQVNNLVGDAGARRHTFTVSADGLPGYPPAVSFAQASCRGKLVIICDSSSGGLGAAGRRRADGDGRALAQAALTAEPGEWGREVAALWTRQTDGQAPG
jgi:hypothetical protein